MPDFDRRRFLSAAAATVAGSKLGFLDIHRRLDAMTGVAAETLTGTTAHASAGTDEIRPFHVSFPDSDLADLRRRITATRWPDQSAWAEPPVSAGLHQRESPTE